MAGRRLEDVFDYFVSPEEQRQARGRVRGRGREEPETPASPVRWGIALSPDRPLICGLAIDLAAALARAGRPMRIVASFERPTLQARLPDVPWLVFEPAPDPASLSRRLGDIPSRAHALVLASPAELAAALPDLAPGSLEGVLVPVDAAPWGLSRALGWLRPLGETGRGVRVAAVVLGAATPDAADALFSKLESAARRQLQLGIEAFGRLSRDEASFESLLRGVPVLDVDESSQSAQQILALSRRLRADSHPATA